MIFGIEKIGGLSFGRVERETVSGAGSAAPRDEKPSVEESAPAPSVIRLEDFNVKPDGDVAEALKRAALNGDYIAPLNNPHAEVDAYFGESSLNGRPITMIFSLMYNLASFTSTHSAEWKRFARNFRDFTKNKEIMEELEDRLGFFFKDQEEDKEDVPPYDIPPYMIAPDLEDVFKGLCIDLEGTGGDDPSAFYYCEWVKQTQEMKIYQNGSKKIFNLLISEHWCVVDWGISFARQWNNGLCLDIKDSYEYLTPNSTEGTIFNQDFIIFWKNNLPAISGNISEYNALELQNLSPMARALYQYRKNLTALDLMKVYVLCDSYNAEWVGEML